MAHISPIAVHEREVVKMRRERALLRAALKAADERREQHRLTCEYPEQGCAWKTYDLARVALGELPDA